MMTNRSLFDELIDIGDRIKAEYEEQENSWWESPFRWLRNLSSRKKGTAAERLVHEMLARSGFVIQQPEGSSDYDRLCYLETNTEKYLRIEIKFSTLWETGHYTFQQIRDQEYDICFCLGISPQSAHAWAVPKEVIWENAEWQHKGKKAQDTKWVSFSPSKPPEWIREYGGELEKAIQVLRRLLNGQLCLDSIRDDHDSIVEKQNCGGTAPFL